MSTAERASSVWYRSVNAGRLNAQIAGQRFIDHLAEQGRITRGQKTLLGTFALFIDAKGTTQKSIAFLAARTGYKERTIQLQIRELCPSKKDDPEGWENRVLNRRPMHVVPEPGKKAHNVPSWFTLRIPDFYFQPVGLGAKRQGQMKSVRSSDSAASAMRSSKPESSSEQRRKSQASRQAGPRTPSSQISAKSRPSMGEEGHPPAKPVSASSTRSASYQANASSVKSRVSRPGSTTPSSTANRTTHETTGPQVSPSEAILPAPIAPTLPQKRSPGGVEKITQAVIIGSVRSEISVTLHPSSNLGPSSGTAPTEAPPSPPVQAAPPPSPRPAGGAEKRPPPPPSLLVVLCAKLFPTYAAIAHQLVARLQALSWTDERIADYLRRASKDPRITDARRPPLLAVWLAEYDHRHPQRLQVPPRDPRPAEDTPPETPPPASAAGPPARDLAPTDPTLLAKIERAKEALRAVETRVGVKRRLTPNDLTERSAGGDERDPDPEKNGP